MTGKSGHPLKGTCQEKKIFRKQEEAFFSGERCGCENGTPFGSSEQPPPYSPFGSRPYLFPTLHGSLRFFSLKIIAIEPSTSFPIP